MAIRHVQNYYYTMQAQYLELKNDLVDFEQAFKDGYITEDRLEEVKEEAARVQENYDRLRYIMYLLSVPNRPKKEKKFNEQNKKQLETFKKLNADLEMVKTENAEMISNITDRLQELTK